MENIIYLKINLIDKRRIARELEQKIDKSSEQFITDMNDWHIVHNEIQMIEQELRWARFISFCNTACWHYEVA